MFKLCILVSMMLILGFACGNAEQDESTVIEQSVENPAVSSSSPEAAFSRFIEAMQNGDAATVLELYPDAVMPQLEMQLWQMKNDTTGQVTLVFAQMGIEVTPEELQDWTIEDMLEAQITSPMAQGQFDGVTVVGSTVEGNTAIVEFEMTIVEQITMSLEDGQWKMAQGF